MIVQELYICHSNLKLVIGGQYLIEVVLKQMTTPKKRNKYGSVSMFPQRHNFFRSLYGIRCLLLRIYSYSNRK
jgi:hypothetical protein